MLGAGSSRWQDRPRVEHDAVAATMDQPANAIATTILGALERALPGIDPRLAVAAGVIATVLVFVLLGARLARRRDPSAMTRAERFAYQAEVIEGVRFEPLPVLNREERRLFAVAEAAAREAGDYRVLAQVNLGELLRPVARGLSEQARRRAFLAINSKRVDMVIVDAAFRVRAAIEYHGTGHRLDRTSAMRDAVKRRALDKVGVVLIEVEARYDPRDVAALLRRHLAGERAVPDTAGPSPRRDPASVPRASAGATSSRPARVPSRGA